MNPHGITGPRLGAAMLAAAIGGHTVSAEAITPKEVMNVVALTESSAITIESLRTLGYISGVQDFNVAGSYSDSGFSSLTTGVVDGQAYAQAYTATLTGDIGEDISIGFSSFGLLGSSTFSTSGTLTWDYNAARNNYRLFEYSENGEINPVWVPIVIGIGTSLLGAAVWDWITDDGQTININGSNNTVVKDGNNIHLSGSLDNGRYTATVASIPEPSSYALLLAGLGAVGYALRRRSHSRWPESA